MAKQGQHKNDSSGPTSGRNNPTQSVPITAGTPKKQETYEEQAREGKDPGVQAQQSTPERSTRDHRERDGEATRARNPRSGRSGSDSNASSGARG